MGHQRQIRNLVFLSLFLSRSFLVISTNNDSLVRDIFFQEKRIYPLADMQQETKGGPQSAHEDTLGRAYCILT